MRPKHTSTIAYVKYIKIDGQNLKNKDVFRFVNTTAGYSVFRTVAPDMSIYLTPVTVIENGKSILGHLPRS
jgi:hypothetical protein